MVIHCGRICRGNKQINFSTVFPSQAVGIKEVHDDIWLVVSWIMIWVTSIWRPQYWSRGRIPVHSVTHRTLKEWSAKEDLKDEGSRSVATHGCTPERSRVRRYRERRCARFQLRSFAAELSETRWLECIRGFVDTQVTGFSLPATTFLFSAPWECTLG